MTATALTPLPMPQFFDANSVELVNGKLSTYAAGTTTPISVYTDISGSNTFTNPIILNSRGEPTYNGASNAIWLTPGIAYKFVLEDAGSNIIWTVDNISTGSNAIALNYLIDTGTTNALAVALAPTPSSYATPMEFFVLVANTNTGATTVNVSSLGAKNVTLNGLALAAGALQANQVYLLVYDGTYFEIQSLPGPGAWATNAYLAVMAAGTVKANITNSSAAPSDVLIPSLIIAGIYAADTGSANVYAAAPTAPPVALAAGYLIAVKIAHTNTGASTLNVNSIGATAIQFQGAALAAGMLQANIIAVFLYDGTNFQLVNAGQGAGNSGGATTVAYPAGSGSGTISAQGWYTQGGSGNIVNWAVQNIQDYGNANYTPSSTWTYTKAFSNGNILGFGSQNAAVISGQTSGGFPGRGTAMPVSITSTTSAWCAQNTDQNNTVAAYYLWVVGN